MVHCALVWICCLLQMYCCMRYVILFHFVDHGKQRWDVLQPSTLKMHKFCAHVGQCTREACLRVRPPTFNKTVDRIQTLMNHSLVRVACISLNTKHYAHTIAHVPILGRVFVW